MPNMKTDGMHCSTQRIQNVLREHIADKNPATKKAFIRFVNEFIEFCCKRWGCTSEEIDFAKCTVLEVGERVILLPVQREVFNSFLQQIPKSTPRYQARRVLYIIFNYVFQEGVFTENPVPKPKGMHTNPKQGLTITQIEELILEINRLQNPLRTAYIIAFSAGLRVSETCALRTSDIVQENGDWTISICREALKGRRAWKIPLPDVSRIIEDYMKWREDYKINSEFFLTNKNGIPLSTQVLYNHLIKINIKGLERNVTPHDLRRAYATVMDKFVPNSDIIVQALRHRLGPGDNDRVSRGYVRNPTVEELARWVELLPSVKLSESIAAIWLTENSK